MMKQLFKYFLVTILGLFGSLAINSTIALTYPLPEEGNVIGQYQTVTAKKGETLLDIAKRYDIGVGEMLSHNKGKGIYMRLRAGTKVTVPSRFTLPSGPREGLVLNLAKMRLFHYNGSSVTTYPVGIGKKGWSTPQGESTVTGKTANPTWHPPKSLRREAARRGRRLPLSIPPGPRNPLGKYALYLGFSGILLHGTIQPSSIGTRSSHGCIRLFSHNIQKLFQETAIGTPIRIVSE